MSAPTDFLYNNARSLFSTGALDWPTSSIKAALLNELYTPSLDDQHMSDIPSGAVIIRDVALTSLGQTDGICFGNIPQFNALMSVSVVRAVLLYKSTGVDSTSPLIYYSSTGPGFPFAAQGFNYFVGYSATNGGWFQI